jgi:7-carboxy-7-deazaguanine synthase
MSLDAVLDRVGAACPALVCITGGEPLLQTSTPTLAARLCDAGHTVLIETNGSQDVAVLDERVIKVLDIKCLDSGMAEHNSLSNLEQLTPRDQVKFVLSSRRDFDYMETITRRYQLLDKVVVLVSPAHGHLEPRTVARWILQAQKPYRLGLQLHRFIWPEKTRGV